MGKETIRRPDSGEVKTMMAAASRIDAKLGEVAASEDTQRSHAQNCARALFDDRVRKALEEMDVEHINKARQGIRVSLLRDAGIENVYQLSRLTCRTPAHRNHAGIVHPAARQLE